jgi:hypothetical protein
MKTTKLIVTHWGRLGEKYGEDGLARVREALERLAEADEARAVRTLCVGLDEPAETDPYGVSALKGKATPFKCKRVIDKLCAALAPDYLVIVGAGDVIPHFEAPNPSFNPAGGDDDERVPTDNPYACSRPYSAKKRESYLIPDRVVGRLPDLPGGGGDPSWLLEGLEVARSWTSRLAGDYAKDLLVCCDSWRKSGKAVASYLSRAAESLMIAPPSLHTNVTHPPILTGSYGHLFHVIKCHGAPLDTMFYGQKGDDYPAVMSSRSLSGRTAAGALVGAMCCYGAALFDPADPRVNAEEAGDAPIPSVYLRQGAYGFVGSTTVAWVGLKTMECADWIVASFMRYVMGGASTGRALLDAKQEFVRWISQQGRNPDAAEEKTLIQFQLLGDPSVHPVTAAGEVAALAEASGAAGGAVAAASRAFERRRRRSFRRAMAAELRKGLPTREVVAGPEGGDGDGAPSAEEVRGALGETFAEVFGGYEAGGRPLVHRVVGASPEAESAAGGAEFAAAGGGGATAGAVAVAAGETFQYYWAARKKLVGPVIDARMIKVETDGEGQVLRTQVLVTA